MFVMGHGRYASMPSSLFGEKSCNKGPRRFRVLEIAAALLIAGMLTVLAQFISAFVGGKTIIVVAKRYSSIVVLSFLFVVFHENRSKQQTTCYEISFRLEYRTGKDFLHRNTLCFENIRLFSDV